MPTQSFFRVSLSKFCKISCVIADSVVKVGFIGAGSTCPGAQHTLDEWMETVFKEVGPEIKCGIILINILQLLRLRQGLVADGMDID